jgi:hypothetical protein
MDYLIVLWLEIIVSWRVTLPFFAVALVYSIFSRRKKSAVILTMIFVLSGMAAYQFEIYN